MIKIRAKLILAFAVTILICSIATLAVTLGGYNLMISGIAASADSNNARIISIREIGSMISRQQQILSRSAINKDTSKLSEIETEGEKIRQAADNLAQQSADKERAELDKFKGLADQYTQICITDVAAGIGRTDRAKYDSLLTGFTAKYDSLIKKETELKEQIADLVDATSKRVADASGSLMGLSGEQLVLFNELLPVAEKILAEYKAAVDKNADLFSVSVAQQQRISRLEADIGVLLEEIAGLRAELEALTENPSGHSGQPAAGQPYAASGQPYVASGQTMASQTYVASGQTTAYSGLAVDGDAAVMGTLAGHATTDGVQNGNTAVKDAMTGYATADGTQAGDTTAYDQALEDSIRTYLDNILLNGTNIKNSVSRLKAADHIDALNKLSQANMAVAITMEAYGAAQSQLAGSGGDAVDFKNVIQRAEQELLSLETGLSADNAALASEAAKSCAELGASIDQLFAAKQELENTGLKESFAEAAELYDQQTEVLALLENSYKTYLADDIDKSERLKNQLLLSLAGIAFLSLFIGMSAALWLSRNILGPIRSLTRLLDKAGKGDLTDRVRNGRRDELGELGEKVNVVLDGQQQIIEQVKTTTGNIGILKNNLVELFSHSRENAGKVSNSFKGIMESIMSGIRQQTADTDEAAGDEAAVDEAADTLVVSAGRAVEDGIKAMEIAANGERSVQEAEEVIRNVTDTVRQIADSINELEDSSSKIGNITNTITDIASKTNLLALNAAIEAARAGQQGKGFTVLADEIRKLSEGSNKAAHEIKQLISEIQGRIQYAVERIGDGVNSVDIGVGKINYARDSILEITGTVGQIVEALKETAFAISSRQDDTAELVGTIDSLEKAASRTVASGEVIDADLELHQNTIKEMEETTARLDEVTDALNGLLGRFSI